MGSRASPARNCATVLFSRQAENCRLLLPLFTFLDPIERGRDGRFERQNLDFYQKMGLDALFFRTKVPQRVQDKKVRNLQQGTFFLALKMSSI